MGHTRTEVTSGAADAEALSQSEEHRLLASARRRAAMSVLAERTGPVELSDLAAAVAAREGEGPAAEAVAVGLHHTHLPMLDDADVLDYDRHDKRVEAARLSVDGTPR